MRPTTDLDALVKPGKALATGRSSSRSRTPEDGSVGASASTNDCDEDCSKSSSPISASATKGSSKEAKRPSRDSVFNTVTPTDKGDFLECIATSQRDELTGTSDTKPTTFVWGKLGDSRLKIRGRAGWDVVENFTLSSDTLNAPDSITKTSIASSNGTIRKLVAGQINAKVLSQDKFLANQAAAFECKDFNGLFVAFNDGRAGYQATSDTLLFLKDLKASDLTTMPIQVI